MPHEPHRRNDTDRRRRPTPMLSRFWLRGRRREGRREGEDRDLYVDRYSRAEWWLFLALLGLAIVDGAWTLAHLGRGVEEANPLMAWTWRQGGAVGFSTVKLVATFGALAFLLLHARFRWTRVLLPIAVVCYGAVMGIHLATELAIPST